MAESAVMTEAERDAEYKRAFPDVNPGMFPLGSRVLVQIKTPPSKAGSIILTDYTKDAERDNTTVARVISVGTLAFKKRDTMELWPEGAWCQPGDYVFVPKYGGLRFRRDNPINRDEPAEFSILEDTNVIASVEDPLSIKAFV